MKKLLLILLFLPFIIQAQLQGIGIFKINKTSISIIDTICSKFSLQFGKIDDYTLHPFDGGSHMTKRIFEFKKDSVNPSLSSINAYSQKNVRVFYLNYLEMSEVGIEDIYLTFYNDTLIQIICEASVNSDWMPHVGLKEALNLKYGNPTVKRESKTIYCQNGFGATTTNEERHDEYSWVTKIKNITAKEYYDVSYDNKCKMDLSDGFIIKDVLKIARVEKIESELMAKTERQNKKDVVRRIKNF